MSKGQTRKQLIAGEFIKLLDGMGMIPGQYVWQPRTCDLHVILGGKIKSLKIKASMTRVQMAHDMGRIVGWAEVLSGSGATA